MTENSTTETKKQKKAAKPKGPIRFEAVIPAAVFAVLVFCYFKFFFDNHLKWLIETAGTKGNGAEVDVGYVKTSFLGGDFSIGGIQVTDADEPSKNLVEIGRMNFKFLWDALLRMKFVAENASIENIQVNSPRKKPGFVLPKEIEKPQEGKSGTPAIVTSALADAGKLLEGANPLKDLQNLGNLKSLAQINSLKEELSKKEKEWKQTLDQIPQGKELAALEAKIKGLKIGGTNNPLEIQKQIQDADAVVREVNDKINLVKTKGDALSSDVNKFNSSFKEIEALVQKDKSDVESLLKIPSLDVKSLSQDLFAQQIRQKLGKYERYINMAMKYMPPKKTKEEKLAQKPQFEERAKGENIHFPKENSYPLFWLKRAAISSQAAHSPFGGDLAGEVTDVSSTPSQVSRPMKVSVKGNFPAHNMNGFEALVTLDHRTEDSADSIKASVGSFGVEQRILTESPDVKVGFKKAVGSTKVTGVFKNGELNFLSQSSFDKVDYDIAAKNEHLDSILKGAFADIPVVTLTAKATGTFADLNLDIQSNLGEALQKAFEKQIQAKINEARKKIETMIEEQIAKPKAELTKAFTDIKTQFENQVKERTKDVDKVKGQAEGRVNEAKHQATKQVPQNLEDLKKKFGF